MKTRLTEMLDGPKRAVTASNNAVAGTLASKVWAPVPKSLYKLTT
ncbi:hypothetical protein [Paenibacillus ehimensis]|nr:hypothetical protein [Paenibacillus ehimensis]